MTDGTLDEAEDAGRLQRQGERANSYLWEWAMISCCMCRRRLKSCLNDSSVCATLPMAWGYASQYVPPGAALIVHFMMGYDH